MIIALEGIDGSGKTTQSFLLQTELEYEVLKFPNYERFPEIKAFLQGEKNIDKKALFLLFLADILEGVNNKDNIIIDRYFYSTIAYSTIDFDKAKKIIELLNPKKADYVFLLDIDPQEGLKRKSKIKALDEYEKNLEFLTTVRERYLTLAKEQFMGKWYVLNASKRPLEIFAEIKEKLKLQ